MRSLQLFIVIFALFLFSLSAYAEREYRLGVRAFAGSDAAYERWGDTIDKLNSMKLGRFVLIPVKGFKEMEEMVKSEELDLVLTQPAEYLRLHKKYGVLRIVTLLNKHNGYHLNTFASVIFTRSDRDDISTLSDIKDKVFAGISANGLGGYLLGVKEISKYGLEPYRDYIVVFTGSQTITVKHVLSGKADVGVVRTGVIEKLVEKGLVSMRDIKVLGRRNDNFPLMHSTMQVPEWSLAVVKKLSREEVSRIATSLLTDSSSYRPGNSARWTTPISHETLYDLTHTLEIGDYAENESSLNPSYSMMILMGGAIIAVIAIFTVLVFGRKF